MVETKLAVGIDIGGTNIKYGIVNHLGEILMEGRLKTLLYPTIESFVEGLYNVLSPIIAAHSTNAAITGIGIGAPNANHISGSIEHSPNLLWKGIVPVARLVSEKFGLPCAIDNDANVAALGELKFGGGKGMKDFITITLGTGVGSGIVVDGKILYGNKGIAGELGHTVVHHKGRKNPATGFKGTIESYCSAKGVVLTAKKYRDRAKEPTLLHNYSDGELNPEVVYACALEGDAIAKKVYSYTGRILGKAFANFVHFSSPEAIFLFGGVAQAGNMLLEPAKKAMEKNLLIPFRGQTQLLAAS